MERGVWLQSTSCGGGSCIEVMQTIDGAILFRDSNDRDTVLVFNEQEWDAFIAGVKENEFTFE